MSSTTTRATHQPLNNIAFFVSLSNKISALRQRRRDALVIHQLLQLEPHILNDIGVDEKALHGIRPVIARADGAALHP
jgi:uncharacterized protein YjiS (DUF1127 family)